MTSLTIAGGAGASFKSGHILPAGATFMPALSLCDPQVLTAVQTYGDILAQSQLMGTKVKVTGQALVLLAFSEGISITELQRKYHIVNGTTLSMRADYMRAEFRRLGGTYKWLNTGDDGKVATLFVKFKENEVEVSYSIDDAKREGLIKAGSRWEKEPGSMLRARVATKAIRMVAPEVVAGFATDEELEASTVEGHAQPVEVHVTEPVNPTLAAMQEVLDSARACGDQSATRAVEAAVVAVKTVTGGSVATESRPTIAMATEDQQQGIRRGFDMLNMSIESELKALKKRDATKIDELTEVAAAELLKMIGTKLAEQQKARDESAGTTATERPSGPITTELATKIEAEVKKMAQQPGGKEKYETIKTKLDQHSVKLRQLSMADGQVLLDALVKGDLAPFFALELAAYVAPTEPSGDADHPT